MACASCAFVVRSCLCDDPFELPESPRGDMLADVMAHLMAESHGATLRWYALLVALASACGGARDATEAASGGQSGVPALIEVARWGCASCEGPDQLTPMALSVDDQGAVTVLDRYEPRIRSWSLAGDRTAWGRTGQGPGDVPATEVAAIWTNRVGEVTFVSLVPPLVVRFSGDGGEIGRATLPLMLATSLAFDGEQDVLFGALESPLDDAEGGTLAVGLTDVYELVLYTLAGPRRARSRREIPRPTKAAAELDRERAQEGRFADMIGQLRGNPPSSANTSRQRGCSSTAADDSGCERSASRRTAGPCWMCSTRRASCSGKSWDPREWRATCRSLPSRVFTWQPRSRQEPGMEKWWFIDLQRDDCTLR